MGHTPHGQGGSADLVMLGQPAVAQSPSSQRLREARLKPSDNHSYFDAVARHGSIRKAADALHMASSALNRRILDLEQEVGMALFERLPRGVRLTAAGELLLAYVRRSLKDLRQVESDIEQLRGKLRGVVRIAVAESVTPSLLPDAISSYQKTHPGVAFQVIVDGPEALQDALIADGADLILTHEVPQSSSVSVLAVARHRLCALVSPEHPLTKLDSVSLFDCMSFPLAVPDHSLAARALLDLAMEDAGLPLNPALESDSIEMLRAFARLGEAVCFSFRLDAREPAHGLVALPLADARCADAGLYLAARKGRVLPVAAASFAEELEAAVHGADVRTSVSVA
jgi:DNA-binding transcriptional LysR family regulator